MRYPGSRYPAGAQSSTAFRRVTQLHILTSSTIFLVITLLRIDLSIFDSFRYNRDLTCPAPAPRDQLECRLRPGRRRRSRCRRGRRGRRLGRHHGVEVGELGLGKVLLPRAEGAVQGEGARVGGGVRDGARDRGRRVREPDVVLGRVDAAGRPVGRDPLAASRAQHVHAPRVRRHGRRC